MDDLISRQAAIDMIEKHLKWTTIPDYYPGIFEAVRGWLNGLPSAQPEIIRCKDCKYYKYGICMKIGANKSFHGFCDWAERGEQE